MSDGIMDHKFMQHNLKYSVEHVTKILIQAILLTNAACTLAENRPKLSDLLVGRSFLGIWVFGRLANQQKYRPKSSLVLIKYLPKIG